MVHYFREGCRANVLRTCCPPPDAHILGPDCRMSFALLVPQSRGAFARDPGQSLGICSTHSQCQWWSWSVERNDGTLSPLCRSSAPPVLHGTDCATAWRWSLTYVDPLIPDPYHMSVLLIGGASFRSQGTKNMKRISDSRRDASSQDAARPSLAWGNAADRARARKDGKRTWSVDKRIHTYYRLLIQVIDSSLQAIAGPRRPPMLSCMT
ncbi:hypothetical protein C8Q73DRAFT_296351 [Cubamyces lactineus]|nr:hypothetical protein C8Q73DRAFT_296351 [Cubamyces lactineus]